jgi:hypothetical protein
LRVFLKASSNLALTEGFPAAHSLLLRADLTFYDFIREYHQI